MGEPSIRTINKRTRAREALRRSCACEKAAGPIAEPSGSENAPAPEAPAARQSDASLGDRIAHGIATVVDVVTSRPPGPLPVDAKGGASDLDVLRTPTVKESDRR